MSGAGSFALREVKPSPLFVADDGWGDPCVWIDNPDNPELPIPLLTPHDIPEVGRDVLWRRITHGLDRRTESRPDTDPHRGLSGHDNARKRADS